MRHTQATRLYRMIQDSTGRRGHTIATFSGKRLFSVAVLLWLLGFTCLHSNAQETVVTELQNDGFELFRKGVYWWVGPGNCTPEIPIQSTIRFQPTAMGGSYTQTRSCLINQGTEYNVARDDLQFYFFSQGQLHRKAVWDSAAAPSTAFWTHPDTPTLPHQESTPLDLANGWLYWGNYYPDLGWIVFNRMKAAPLLFEIVRPPETVAAIFDGGSPVMKLKVFQYYDSASGTTIDGLVALLRNGKLYRCKFTTGTADLLASGVTDFAIHKRYLLLSNPVTSIYAAKGTLLPTPSSPAGQVLRIDADTLATTTIYTASGINQVIAVATDSEQLVPLLGGGGGPRNIYVTEAVVGGCPACGFVRGDIFKHSLPYTGGGWTSVIATVDGSNLRSDDNYLYYREAAPGGVSIMRIAAGAEPYQFDYAADGLEVVQASQDLNNSFQLVRNRTTFVRGYARLTVNSPGKTPHFPTAQLRGWNGSGVELPDSPLLPLNSPAIDETSSLDNRRADLNRSFLFRLPDSWVNGKVTLRMEVNPFRIQKETGPGPGIDAYDNNQHTIFPGLDVTPKGDPCLVLVPVLTKAPLYNPESPDSGVWDIAERARSLLPINRFKLFKSTSILAKPVVNFCASIPPWCPGFEPFDLPDNKTAALNWLSLHNTFSTDPSCASGDVHWVGAVHRDTPGGFGGIGRRPGSSLLTQMYLDGPTPWNKPLGGRTLAHELGHNYDKQHINQWPLCGEKEPAGPYDPYPYDPCTIGPISGPTAMFGFDPITHSVIRPTDAGELMTYSPNRWISKPTWDALFATTSGGAAFGAAASPTLSMAANLHPVLLIHGTLRLTENRAELLPFYVLPPGAADPQKVARSFAAAAQLNPGAPFKVRLLDALGNLLLEVPLVTSHDEDGEPDIAGFVQFVPFVPAARRVQIINDALVLSERIASAHGPALTLQPPLLDALNQSFDLNWSASDADNDPILFTVQYSANDGATWEAVTVGYPWLSLHVDARDLHGSTHARFRVIATDGFNTTLATSDPVNIPRHPPQPQIAGVSDHQRLRFGEPVTLRGNAFDAEEGSLSGDQLNWNIAGPGPTLTVTGNSVSLDDLVPGQYSATLSAVDSDNNAAQVQYTWEILPPSFPDGQTPELDGEANDPAYANARVVRIPLGGGAFARALLLHSGSNLFVCLTDLPLPPNSPIPPVAGLRVDADKSGGPLAWEGDIGFFVNGDGLLWEETGTAQGLVIPALPLPGFSAVTQRGATGWSAEFRIADSLLGGWNHSAGLMFDVGGAQWPPNASAGTPLSWAEVWLGATPPTPSNRPPSASAGESQSVNIAVATTIHLDGNASTDPDGDTLSFLWTQLAGPPVELIGATTAAPHFLAPLVTTPTTLRFRLVVNDGQFNSASSDTQVTLLPTRRPEVIQNSGFSQVRLLDGLISMRLFGEPGARHFVEASSNLVHWETVFSRTADFFGGIDFMLQDMTNWPTRFYRTLPVINDSFRNRFPLAGSSNTLSSLNRLATKEPGEPNHAGNIGGSSIWFSWTAAAPGSVTISTIGSGFDTLLGVYIGSALDQLQPIAADDDNGGNLTSSVSFEAAAGVTYQIAVDGYGGASGTIQLNISMP